VEGYAESAASGILAGVNMDRMLSGAEPVVPPPTTMLGGLFRYLRDATPAQFQPMNSNFGLLEPLAEYVRDKTLRREKTIARAREQMKSWNSDLLSLCHERLK
jgi:methylenetetrahydrofolate--tRNA-(uracil-5-)-methyltransferase